MRRSSNDYFSNTNILNLYFWAQHFALIFIQVNKLHSVIVALVLLFAGSETHHAACTININMPRLCKLRFKLWWLCLVSDFHARNAHDVLGGICSLC
jgi:hypothetical protein